MELHGRSHAFCHSCSGRLARIDTVPPTLAGIRELLNRERRAGERRGEGVDRRIFPRERRVGERRLPDRAATAGTDPHIALVDLDDIVVEIEAAEAEPFGQTMVRQPPERNESG
jgi:hypothetical protein